MKEGRGVKEAACALRCASRISAVLWMPQMFSLTGLVTAAEMLQRRWEAAPERPTGLGGLRCDVLRGWMGRRGAIVMASALQRQRWKGLMAAVTAAPQRLATVIAVMRASTQLLTQH